MFSFLQRELPAVGRVAFPGAIPLPLEQFSVSRDPVSWKAIAPAREQVWAVEATHPVWGTAEIACDRSPPSLADELIEHTFALSPDEKSRARLGRATVAVRVRTQQKHVLRNRKGLLFWLRAIMQSDGVVAVDGSSTLVKLGYEVEGGGPTDREHLWFAVHHVTADKVDATLANTPHQVPGLTAGQRGEHDLARLTDWTILSPGPDDPAQHRGGAAAPCKSQDVAGANRRGEERRLTIRSVTPLVRAVLL